MNCQACKKSLKAQYQSDEFAFDAATFSFFVFFSVLFCLFSLPFSFLIRNRLLIIGFKTS